MNAKLNASTVINPGRMDRAGILCLAAVIAETLDRNSSVDEFVAAGDAEEATQKHARGVLVGLNRSMADAKKLAEVCEAHAKKDAANIAAWKDAKKTGRKYRTPWSESVYIQARSLADETGAAFTIRKLTDKKTGTVTFYPCENIKTARDVAASGQRADRKVTEPRADLTDGQALRQIRALLKLASTRNSDTVAAVAAILAPAASVSGKLPKVAKRNAA